jgi:cold-inducible RNA-binding protein
VKKIYVGNLSFDTTDSTLRTLFSAYGTISSATVLSDRETGRSRGFGFVEMENDSEAMAAIQGLNGKAVDGRNLNVNEARPREPRQGGGGGGGGGRPRW